jgi:hypothetical protein
MPCHYLPYARIYRERLSKNRTGACTSDGNPYLGRVESVSLEWERILDPIKIKKGYFLAFLCKADKLFPVIDCFSGESLKLEIHKPDEGVILYPAIKNIFYNNNLLKVSFIDD